MTAIERSGYELSQGGSVVEAVGGVAAVVLAILGFAHVSPRFLEAIGVIVLGIAVLSLGTSLTVEYARQLVRPADTALRVGDFGAGWSIAPFAGVAAIVLGVLGVIGIAEAPLDAVAVIVLGAALVMTVGAVGQLGMLRTSLPGADEAVRRAAMGLASVSAAGQLLAGVAAIVLGVLALAGVAPSALTLAAVLELGVLLALSGSAFGGFAAGFR